jgi:cellulose biosynthesis protein BcsQ
MENGIPKVITFSANKGGAGKTRTALLTTNCLGVVGQKFWSATVTKEVLELWIAENEGTNFWYTQSNPEEGKILLYDSRSQRTENRGIEDIQIACMDGCPASPARHRRILSPNPHPALYHLVFFFKQMKKR